LTDGGWLKLYRVLIQKPIWKQSTPEQKAILITLLCMVNHEEQEWEWQGRKYICKPGQVITSLEKIAKEAGKGITLKNVRTAIDRFQKYGFLANESTNKNRLITITNWELYQSGDDEQASKRASNGQATGKQRATNKNNKNDKNNINNIYNVIFEHWNSKKIIVHKKLTDKIKRKISGALNTYSPDEIKKAIDNYSTVLTSDEYYWTYKWTLEDFLQRGLEKFLTDACFENYKKGKEQPTKKAPNAGNFQQRKYTNDEIEKFYTEV